MHPCMGMGMGMGWSQLMDDGTKDSRSKLRSASTVPPSRVVFINVDIIAAFFDTPYSFFSLLTFATQHDDHYTL
jgi:hypothetical protein